MKLKNLTLIAMFLLLIAFSGTAANAQSSGTPAPAASDELKTQEQIVDELKLRRQQVEALTSERDTLKAMVALQGQIITNERERADFFKTAAESRKGANEIDARVDVIRREQLEIYRLEVISLREENDKLRRSRDRWRLFGTGAAAAAVFIAKP